MKISPHEYQQGVIHWNIPDVLVHVTSTSGLDDEWSESLVSSSGSVAMVPPRRFKRVGIVSDDPSSVRPPYQVRWEFLDEVEITTAIWEGDLRAPAVVLKRVPNYGTFHRLVVATPLLVWPEDAVFRAGDVVVRLGTGAIIGEAFEGPHEVRLEGSELSFTTGKMQTDTFEGRFVEIVAPGESAQVAETQAYALLGFLALCLGDHTVGQIVFSEAYEARPGEQAARVAIPTIGRAPWPVAADEIAAVETGFAHEVREASSRPVVPLALSWYEHGVRVETALDKLIAFFVGIEAIITEHAAMHKPLPVVAERERTYADQLSAIKGLGRVCIVD